MTTYIARKPFVYRGIPLTTGDVWTPQGIAVDTRLIDLDFVREAVQPADAIDVANLPFADTASTLEDALSGIDEGVIGAVVGGQRRVRRHR